MIERSVSKRSSVTSVTIMLKKRVRRIGHSSSMLTNQLRKIGIGIHM